MSDHVDGPRSIGDPAADITDLFAFTSPENPARTVLAMCVFPSAGEDAIFSNVIDYSIVVRRVTVAGVGNAAKFQPADDEIRFSFRFEVLKRDAAGKVIQRGVCTLPGGRTLSLTVNDEKGASTPEGDVRVFAGLRSDPFYLAWDRRRAQEGSQSAAARQRALHRRRARHAPRARSREGLVVRRDRRDRPHPAAASPHRTSSPPHRLGRTPRADEHTAQQSRDVGGRRFTRPVESADAVRDPEGAAAAVPAAPEGQLRRLGHARRQGRLDAGSARRQRECLPRRFSAVRCRQADHRRKPPRDREEHDRRPPLPDGRRPHGRRELDRHPAHLARQPRSRVPPGRRDRGDEARHEGVSVFRDAEHGTADRRRIGRACGGARRRCGR